MFAMRNKVVEKFLDRYKQRKPNYKSWNIKYYLPTTRIKITIPDGIKINKECQPTKIVGLGFKLKDFRSISRILGEVSPTDFLFSENLWLVDEEQKHHLVVGYIIRKSKTLILFQFWLLAEGMYDLIKNAPIGIIIFSTNTKDTRKAFEELTKIIQSRIGKYKLLVADLEPFKHEEPMRI